jgi:GT2 family glycosyltransferase
MSRNKDVSMSSASPKVSIIIASYRRQAYLLKTLDQLVAQDYQPDEVFVVDASPVEEQLSKAHHARYPKWLSYVRFMERGNASRQRDTALKLCAGDIVLFLDDDVEFGRDLIDQYVRAFRETGADGINGIVLVPNERPSNAPKLVQTIPIQYPGAANYQAYDGIIDTHVICSASFAATRSALLAVGGFDEQLHGSRDDVDLALRMIKKGFRVIHHNGPCLLHLMARGNGSRSPEMGREWTTANLFYFQFTHFWPRRRSLLMWRTLWDYCRPSRHWLEPAVISGRWTGVVRAYREAVRRVNEGPKLCISTNGNGLEPRDSGHLISAQPSIKVPSHG